MKIGKRITREEALGWIEAGRCHCPPGTPSRDPCGSSMGQRWCSKCFMILWGTGDPPRWLTELARSDDGDS